MRSHRLVLLAAVPALAAPLVLASPALAHSPHQARGSYTQTVLVTDQGTAPVVDPLLINPWGVAFSASTPAAPGSPLWTSNEGSSTSTLYRGTSAANAAKVTLTVSTPKSPTGVVFNSLSATPTAAFRLPDGTASRFIFDTLGGEIAAWAPPATSTVRTVLDTDAAYTGLAIGATSAGPRLFAADFNSTLVRVFDGDWHLVGVLSPHRLPHGLFAYGVAFLNGDVYVTYAAHRGQPAAVGGAVQVFRGADGDDDGVDDTTGVQTVGRRLVTGGPLDEPWGLAIAPKGWGRFGGDLLVGNVETGQIDAFSLRNGRSQGVVSDATGKPITDEGLWGIQFGNGTIGTPQDLVVAAGTGGYRHGLVALIRPSS